MGGNKSTVNDSHRVILQENGVNISKERLITVKTGNIEKEYNFVKILGSGAFGEVRLAKHLETNTMGAIKGIYRDDLEASPKKHRMLLSEYEILKQVDHPHIIRIFDLWKDEAFYYIITEYLEGGELYKTISKRDKFTEKDCSELIKQVLLALNYCHKNDIVHRDLKPENILFEGKELDSNVRLVDFGFACAFNPDKGIKEVLGTPLFIAPEIISEKKYGSKGDIWSLGVITFFLICGYPPFDGHSRDDLFQKIRKGKVSFDGKIWDYVSNECIDFISRCLKVDPGKRFSAEDCLNHCWIKSNPSIDIDDEIEKTSLQNLRNYSHHNKFQQGVVHYLTYKGAQKDEIKKLSNLFKEIDTNQDGKLTIEEMEKYIKKVTGTINFSDVKEVFDHIDIDKSGYIDYSEFLSATIDKKTLLRENQLRLIFKEIDKDGSGNISKVELRKAFQTKGTK